MDILSSPKGEPDIPTAIARDSKLFCILMSINNSSITTHRLSILQDQSDMFIWINILIDLASILKE